MAIPIIIKHAISKEDKALIAAAAAKQELENSELSKKLGVPISYKLMGAASTIPELIKNDNGSYGLKVKEIIMPRYIFGRGGTNKALDALTIRHELAEAEAIGRGNMRPTHTHADPSVLYAEYRALRNFPAPIKKKWFEDMRNDDIRLSVEYNQAEDIKDPEDLEQYPLMEKLLLSSAKKDDLPLKEKELIDAYDKSQGHYRSFIYRSYIDDMLRRAAGKDDENDTNNVYNMFNDKLLPSLRKDLSKEEATAKDIYSKSKKGILPGAIIGGIVSGMGAIPYLMASEAGRKEKAIVGLGAALPGMLLGGSLGKIIRKSNEIEKAYFPKAEDESNAPQAKIATLMTKDVSDMITPDRKYPLSYLSGEIKELISAIKHGDRAGIDEEASDVSYAAQMLLHQNTGINFPLIGARTPVNKFLERREMWKSIMEPRGIEFNPEYLREGANYHKPDKIRKALAAAGYSISDEELGSLENQVGGFEIPISKSSGDDSEEPSAIIHSHSPSQVLRPRSEVIIYSPDGILGIVKPTYLLLPGGGVADGESPEGSAIRESIEEADAILKNMEPAGKVDTTYDKDNIICEGWDGETTYFFTALYGGPAKTMHPDREDFKFIPFDECISFLKTLLSNPKEQWAAENNRTRMDNIMDLQTRASSPGTFALKKLAYELQSYRLGKKAAAPTPPSAASAPPRKDSSVLYDFMAGVEPTGTYTFNASRRNTGRHGMHKAINAAGGFIGGAAIIPAVIGAAALGVPRYIGAGKGRSLKIIGDAAIKPYASLYYGARAKREMANIAAGRGNSTKYVRKMVGMTPINELGKQVGSVGKGFKPIIGTSRLNNMDDIISGAIKSNPEMAKTINKNISYGLGGGIGMIGLSGATNSMSAVAQYNSGLKAKSPLGNNA